MHISDARFAELLRLGAEQLIETPAALQAAVDEATMHFVAPAEAPGVTKVIQRSNMLSIVHMLSQIVRSPGSVPAPVLSDELITLLERRVQSGTAELTIKGFRVGQAAAWRVWMRVAFTLSDNPAELHGLLDRSSVLLGSYIEQTIELANSHIERFRTELARGAPTSHRELIMAILDGQTIDPIAASRRLAYPLTGTHRALVVWSDDLAADQQEFERFLSSLAELQQTGALVSLFERPATLWVWFSGQASSKLSSLLSRHGVRAALGTAQSGLPGFTRTHRQALEVQDVARPAGVQATLVGYEEARLPILMLKDKRAFETFATEVLGALRRAEPVYLDSLRSYLAHGCNLLNTAQALGIHRNTLQKRLERISDLLPEPLSPQNRLQIGAALGCLGWGGIEPAG